MIPSDKVEKDEQNSLDRRKSQEGERGQNSGHSKIIADSGGKSNPDSGTIHFADGSSSIHLRG
jgi:hypothetical protein